MRPTVNVPKEDRATDTGNKHKKLGEDRACGSADIIADRLTDRHTDRQTYLSQYFATTPAGEVIRRLVRPKCAVDKLCQKEENVKKWTK